MKRLSAIVILILIAICTSAPLGAQDSSPDRITVNWSDPSRPGLVQINLLNGGITVKVHSGNNVIVESRSGRNNRRTAPAEVGGLRRIDANATGLTIEEQNNVMTIGTSHRGPGTMSSG